MHVMIVPQFPGFYKYVFGYHSYVCAIRLGERGEDINFV